MVHGQLGLQGAETVESATGIGSVQHGTRTTGTPRRGSCGINNWYRINSVRHTNDWYSVSNFKDNPATMITLVGRSRAKQHIRTQKICSDKFQNNDQGTVRLAAEVPSYAAAPSVPVDRAGTTRRRQSPSGRQQGNDSTHGEQM